MKRNKSILAVLLSAIMLFTSTGMTAFAEGIQNPVSSEIVVVEDTTESVAEEEATEAKTAEEETTEKETTEEETTKETTTEEIATEDEATEEATAEKETTKEETTEEETTDEASTEEVTTEEQTTVEDEDNRNGSGHKAPQAEMNLTSAMVAEKQDIRGTSDRLLNLQEGVNYKANEAVFLASSKSYADKVAQGYGAVLESLEKGVAVISFEDDITEIIAMAEDMDVKLPAVYPNFIYTTCDEIETEVTADAVDIENIAAAAPNDPLFSSNQIYHTYIKTTNAWDYNNTAGKGVKVAVIDSGINKSHEDLMNRVVSATATASLPYNKAEDNHGHGTHVSGIIAANKNNGLGGAGIAYNASIISIKALENNPVTGNVVGSTADIIKAVNSAVKSGARVINMSLGGYGYDTLYEASIDAAVNKGVVVVAAAGNESTALSTNKNSSSYCSPACFTNVITVSAVYTSATPKLASFSNYGSGIIDITAPGTSIKSSVLDNKYTSMSGTSQATPMVAATAAYILSVSPDLLKNKSKDTVDTVKKILQDSATKTGYSDKAQFGAGLLNVENAVKMAAPSAINNTQLMAPEIKLNGTPLTKNQVIQDTDTITLTSALGTTSNSNIKIYYTTDGKTPTEKSTLYTGPFKVAASGTKTIKAIAVYYGKKSQVSSVSVKVNAYVTGFSISSKSGIYLSSGKSMTLTAGDFAPAYATNKKVKWEITSGSSYATISSSGKLTANKNLTAGGDVTVKATALDKTANPTTATITIKILPAVTRLSLQNTADANITLTYPATKDIKLVTEPATGAPIIYSSSNTKVATVSASGRITAVGAGKATITAKTADGSNKSVKMAVTVVKEIQTVKVTSKTGDYSVAASKTLQMLATVTGDATNKKVDWSVSGAPEGAVSITSTGLLKPVKDKFTSVTTVTVTATAKDDGKKYGTASVKIYPSVTEKLLVEGGTSYSLGTTASGALKSTVQLLPYTDKYTSTHIGRARGSGTTNVSNFTYTSSNTKVATVSTSGVVTAVAPGTVSITIKAKDGSNKSIKCAVKVVNPVTSMLIFSKTGVSFVGKGNGLQLGALTNSNATNKKVRWESLNTTIATVSTSGKVTGKSYGSSTATTKIRAYATDGTGNYAEFAVTVRPAMTVLGFYYYGGGEKLSTNVVGGTLYKGTNEKEFYFPYYIDTASTDAQAVPNDWWNYVIISSSNPNILRIETDKDGYMYMAPVNKGTANIVYKALDGSGKTCQVKYTIK